MQTKPKQKAGRGIQAGRPAMVFPALETALGTWWDFRIGAGSSNESDYAKPTNTGGCGDF